jgi:hypothetical protein
MYKMYQPYQIIITALVFGLMLSGLVWAWHEDKKCWNKGYHLSCGGKWELSKIYTYGENRIYQCNLCGTHTPIEWPVERIK